MLGLSTLKVLIIYMESGGCGDGDFRDFIKINKRTSTVTFLFSNSLLLSKHHMSYITSQDIILVSLLHPLSQKESLDQNKIFLV